MSRLPVEMATAEMEETPSVNARVTGSREASPVPPPGFRPFQWPEAKRIKNGELQRDPGLKFVASWSAKIAEEEGQTETLREDGTRIRTVGKARPWVLYQIPTSVDRRPNNSVRRI